MVSSVDNGWKVYWFPTITTIYFDKINRITILTSWRPLCLWEHAAHVVSKTWRPCLQILSVSRLLLTMYNRIASLQHTCENTTKYITIQYYQIPYLHLRINRMQRYPWIQHAFFSPQTAVFVVMLRGWLLYTARYDTVIKVIQSLGGGADLSQYTLIGPLVTTTWFEHLSLRHNDTWLVFFSWKFASKSWWDVG